MQRDTERADWWTDHTNVAALYRWLCDHDKLDASDVDAVHEFLSTPWSWSPEWEQMHGRAVDPDADEDEDEPVPPTQPLPEVAQ